MWNLVISFLMLAFSYAEQEANQLIAQAPSAPAKPVELLNCNPPPSSSKKDNRIYPEPVVERAAKAQNFDKTEVVARLIFSEAISTGFWNKRCNAKSHTEIMTHIAGGIMYRVHARRAKADPYYATVFEKDQFTTSFASEKAGGNAFAKAFLCPLSIQSYFRDGTSAEKLYAEAYKIAQEAIASYEKEKKLPKEYSRLTNFFYPRSEYYGEIRPNWAPNRDPKQNPGYKNLLNTENPCVEFYEK